MVSQLKSYVSVKIGYYWGKLGLEFPTFSLVGQKGSKWV